MNIPSAEECGRRWKEGMLRTPPVPCPRCGKETRWESRCQGCGAEWSFEEWLGRRRKQAELMLEFCNDETTDPLTRENLKLYAESVLRG